MPAPAFYCVADSDYFLGAVGLVNSLRLVGHDEPIHLLDCGLTDEQRELLRPEVELMAPPAGVPPWLAKTVAPLTRPSPVMLLLDADLVVTRSLAPLAERAGGERLVAFRNPVDRHVAEWGELLGLGTPRRQPYLSSAVICAAREPGLEVLALMDELQKGIDFELTHWRRAVPGYAFTYGDQDVFNAILATRVDPGTIDAIDQRLAPTPPFTGLKLLDESSLRCGYDDGEQPYLVHHHVTKPWLEPTHHGIYSRLLRRLLIGDGLRVRVPEGWLPRRLRTGLGAYAERKLINARERLRWHVGEPLGASRARTGR